MVIYGPMVQEGYEWVECVDSEDYRRFNFDGTRRGQSWRPVKVSIVSSDEGQSFRVSDFPWLRSSALILRPRAVQVIGELLVENGELLPLSSSDGDSLSVLNVTRVLDALDENRSHVLRFPESKRIMLISSYAFHADMVRGVDVFRLPVDSSPTFVSDRFVKRVRDGGLRGLVFEKIWDEGLAPGPIMN